MEALATTARVASNKSTTKKEGLEGVDVVDEAAYRRGNQVSDPSLHSRASTALLPAPVPAPAATRAAQDHHPSTAASAVPAKAEMDLGGHEDHEDIPIPISTQFSAAAIHETAAKLKLLASGNGTPVSNQVVVASGAAAVAEAAPPPDVKGKQLKPVRYRECLKNHAAGIGGHALDGCGEFMPCGEEGTLDGLKCAACDCHRNFHRREVEGEPLCIECHHRKDKKRLAMVPAGMDDQGGGGYGMGGPNMKKRFRTKFTGDQKERMLAFADKVGWKIQKHDEAEVQQFCSEVGVKRHVLKVWMHNNKHTLGKKM